MGTIRVQLTSLEVIEAANGADGDRITIRMMGFSGPGYQEIYLARSGQTFPFNLSSVTSFKEGVMVQGPLLINLSREDNQEGFQDFGTLSIDRSTVYGPAWGLTHDFKGQLDGYSPAKPYHYQLTYDVAAVA